MADRVVDVAVDIGNSHTKIQGPGGRIVSFPSVIAEATSILDFDVLNKRDDLVITFEGRDYAVGRTAWTAGLHRSYLADRSRLHDPIYRTLFAAALSRVVDDSAVVRVIFSMPVSWYFDREEAKEVLSGKYVVKTGKAKRTYTVPRDEIMVVPEGLGSVIARIYNEQGRVADPTLTQRAVGVVDIGGLTVDYIGMEAGLQIQQALSRSTTPALLGVWQSLGRRISKEYKLDFEPHKLDEIMKERWFYFYDQRVQVDQWVEEALRFLADRINREIATLWSGGAAVQTIVVTGGGATHLYPFIHRQYKTAITESDQPYLANVQGAYRFALKRRNGGKER